MTPSKTSCTSRFKEHWNRYRTIVNQMLAFSRDNRRPEARAIYGSTSRAAYDAASDTLGQLTDQAVANAQAASDRLRVAYRQAFWLILLGMVIAGVMVVAVVIHISRSISAPLLHLADRMRRLARNDTDVDIAETERKDEIGEMARATVVFRNNAIELMRSQRMLARQAAMLEEQLAQEQRLALLQRNFVSMASHEFRTPLTVIDGHARRLMKTKDTVAPAEIDERGGKIRSRGAAADPSDRQSAQLRAADRRRRRALFPARGAGSRRLAARSLPIAPRNGAGRAHHRALSRRPLPAVGDAKLLFQVFSNLLSNAVKYSPSGGAIEVEAASAVGEVVIAVTDHGIGIPAGDIERLFERYHRGSNVSGIVGTGVGLYLVKMAVERHGGRVEVTSKEGAGSRFSIHLPAMHKVAATERRLAGVDAASDGLPISVPAAISPALSPDVDGHREG